MRLSAFSGGGGTPPLHFIECLFKIVGRGFTPAAIAEWINPFPTNFNDCWFYCRGGPLCPPDAVICFLGRGWNPSPTFYRTLILICRVVLPKRSQGEVKRGINECSGRKFERKAINFRAPQTDGRLSTNRNGTSINAVPYEQQTLIL